MLDRTPVVFISYSWSSEEYQERVIDLATRLRRDGVDVKLDVWDLKDGHDKYVYMEQCVTNPVIDKVLILCDKKYAEKANSRQGGVGDETTIISPEYMVKQLRISSYFLRMMQNMTYRNLMAVIRKIEAEGRSFDEAEKMASNIFTEYRPQGMSIDERVRCREEWERENRERGW